MIRPVTPFCPSWDPSPVCIVMKSFVHTFGPSHSILLLAHLLTCSTEFVRPVYEQLFGFVGYDIPPPPVRRSHCIPIPSYICYFACWEKESKYTKPEYTRGWVLRRAQNNISSETHERTNSEDSTAVNGVCRFHFSVAWVWVQWRFKLSCVYTQ